MNCSKKCGEGCDGGKCNSIDGTCLCLPGWELPMCAAGMFNICVVAAATFFTKKPKWEYFQ